jgi:RNA polymerase sigma-70 factor (family 1)
VTNELPPDDRHLFDEIAQGDETAFKTLFHRYLPKLYPFIVKFTRSEQATRDLIQETFIRVWLNRDKLPGIENPGGWLFTVASNECYSYARKNALYTKFSQPLNTESGTAPSTEEWLHGKELHRLISKAVDQLPPQRKKIYQMSRSQGKSIPEIAAELNISPNTVKNALVTALQFIRDYLAKSGISLILFLL